MSMKELVKILEQDVRFVLYPRDSFLLVKTLQSRSLGQDSDPTTSVYGRDHHKIEITIDDKYVVTSCFKVFNQKLQVGFMSHFTTPSFLRIVDGRVKSSRLLELKEVADYIIQLELIDRVIVQHFDKSEDENTLQEINEALDVDYILNWRPLKK